MTSEINPGDTSPEEKFGGVLTRDFALEISEIVKDYPDNLKLSELDHYQRLLKHKQARGIDRKLYIVKAKDELRPESWDKFLQSLVEEGKRKEMNTLISAIGQMEKLGFGVLENLRDLSRYKVLPDMSIAAVNGKGETHFGAVVDFCARAFMSPIDFARLSGQQLQIKLEELGKITRPNPEALDYDLFVRRKLKWIKPRRS